MKEARRKLLAGAVIGLVAACGGGGAGDPLDPASPPSPPSPPGTPPPGPSVPPPPPPPPPPPVFAYIAGDGSDQLIGFALDRSSGALTQVGEPVATGASPRRIEADSLGQVLYVTAFDERRVRSFGVTESGAPSSLSQSNVTFFCWGLALHPSGEFVFATNQGNDRVEIFASDPLTGSLDWLGFKVAFDLPTALAAHPNGRYLYVSQTGNNEIGVFSFDNKTRELTRIVDVLLPTGATQPHALVIDPSGRLLYVSTTGPGGERLCVYSIIDEGPTLAALDDRVPAGTACRDITLHPSGRFVFATYSSSDLVSVYELADGTLDLVGDFGTGIRPMGVAVEPSGNFLYVLDHGSDTVSVYAIASNGFLTPTDPPTLTLPSGFGPTAITFLEKISPTPESVKPHRTPAPLK